MIIKHLAKIAFIAILTFFFLGSFDEKPKGKLESFLLNLWRAATLACIFMVAF